MSDLITQPLFLFGLVVFVAGVGAVTVKAFGVEIGAVTPNRSLGVTAVGLAIMAGGWWAQNAEQFKVTAMDIHWENLAALSCDSVQSYVGAIETTGEPEAITYQIVANGNVLIRDTFLPRVVGERP